MSTFLVMFGCAIALWMLSLKLKDASIADLIWGLWFVIEAGISHWESPTDRSLLMLTLTSIWGLRLSLYLGWRNHGQPEDRRYQAMRAHHGVHFWWRSLFTVFLFQMMIAWIVGAPQRYGSTTEAFSILDSVGLIFFVPDSSLKSLVIQLSQFTARQHRWRPQYGLKYMTSRIFGDALLCLD